MPVGGHGLRQWSSHVDQAYVGQWALSCQSARVPGTEGELFYPVLGHVVERATSQVVGSGHDAMPIVSDLAMAWQQCVHTTSQAVSHGLEPHNSQVEALDTWLRCTEHGDLRHIGRMPDKAQRELSASVVSLDVHAFQCHST